MAEAIYGVVSSILSNLGSDAFQELGEIFRANKELKKLQDTLGTVKAFLVDAEQAAESSELVKNWINRLQDVLYDADDLLDEFQYEHLRQKAHSAERVTLVQNLFSSLTTLPFRLTMHSKVKEIRERLDEVAADSAKFNFRERVITDMGVGNSWRETDSSVVKAEIIGRNKNKEDIINLLLQPTSNQSNVSIVVIVGFGGLGKTALAQLVYNEATIQNHFSSKFWVCVSEEFDNKLLIKKILKSVTGTVGDFDLEQLQRQLREVLGGKRYLIVFDDVWNENSLRWDSFSKYLVDSAPGSKILVTTRNRSVALAMGINSSYVLEGLNSDQSWDLFKHVVSFRGQNKIDTKLELIGKEVVERCRGVPLAIKTLGSLMRQNPNENFWSSIKEDHEAWRTSLEMEDGILAVLKLSYNHLPSHLRPCFAFCAIFPKDFEIPKDRLIQLWNAQGYIQSSIRNKRSLELGDEYYNDLLSRSFFQEEYKDTYGKITCKMHDLIHDLAQLVAGSSFSTVKADRQKIPKEVRHLFVDCQPSQQFWTYLFETKGMIRTIVKFTDFFTKKEVIEIPRFSGNPLRMLALNCMGIKMLPNSIGRLKHLRLLDLSFNGMEVLPDFITNLHNLQTLLLNQCENLKKLPKDISKLISLECLSIKYCSQLKYLPKGLGELTSLQRLSDFIVNIDEKEFSSSATLNELRDLNYLGGNLVIENLDMVRDVELVSNEANLKEKKHLESLQLRWNRGDRNNEKDELLLHNLEPHPNLNKRKHLESSMFGRGYEGERKNEKDELLLDNLEPHPNLKKLEIYGYQGTRFSWWLSSITNLVSLEIRGSRFCQQLPRLDHLPFLESLSLQCFNALEYVADDGIGKEEDPSSSLSCSTSTTATMFFPSLRKLELSDCENLKGWWRKNKNEGATSELPCFPCLSSLGISHCPSLTSMPLFPSLDDKLSLQNACIRPLQQTLMMKTNNTSTASASLSRSSLIGHPLSNLKRLTLDNVDDVETLPEEFLLNLTSLRTLRFRSCYKLDSLPSKRTTHCLTSLQYLELSECPKLRALPEWISTLTSLKTLEIRDCPQVPSLPGGIHLPPSLEELVLSNCLNLRALPEWIPTITSLKTLEIRDCPQVQALPAGMQRLTSLTELFIHGCPNLSETCKEESGIDWPQIAQIPNIYIEDRWVRGKAEDGKYYGFVVPLFPP